jgi:GNAT superfamily N-acetyltransferase
MLIREATPADAAAIARVHVESWRTTYRGIVPDDYLARLSHEGRECTWANALRGAGDAGAGTAVFVAEDDAGQVVGFASGGVERGGDPRYRGELYALYLLDTQQRRGLGHRLVGAVAERLARDGVGTMLTWVLADNPARRFYAAIGGRELRTQQIEIGGATLDEVAFGWDDITILSGPPDGPR